MSRSGGTPPSILSLVFEQLTTGQEVFPRSATDAAWGGPISGRMTLSYFRARKSHTSTGTRALTGDQAAGATPTLAKMALFSIAANGDGTRVAVTASDTSLFAGTYSRYTRNWLANYDVVAGLIYARAVLVVSGAAMPHYVGNSPGVLAAEVAELPYLAKEIGGLADIPASFVAASLADTSYRAYGVVL